MVLYAERSPKPRTWLIFLAFCVAVWVALTVADGGNPAFASIIVPMLGGITALAMWSTGFYGNVTLTEAELRAGRTRLPLADLSPGGVSPEGEPPVGRLLGGAYAASMDRETLGLLLRTGERVRVQAKDPVALRAALNEALAPYRQSA